MSGSASDRRGGTPSTTTPIAGPWLSPQVVKRNSVPKELPAIFASRSSFPRKRESRVTDGPDALDPRFRGGDGKLVLGHRLLRNPRLNNGNVGRVDGLHP